ncbi:TRAP transporter large permease [Aestuariivirga sp. YIM B02566]|uniref:TRAP transporter large permease subunit n=1 Tax=Taklimakanibacter albus TaxID=2800327 RepID=A0ACC5RFW3_9HYPH|nr:TRAP transporter large permease subunit [Aestuariivirga sp. YIM B02566]MBK1871512.1 TRAP transporter large permease subunit [Aestuariivirga sp. YIM B02566]
MTAFLMENMAPIMFAALVIFLLLGYPVAFSLAFVGLGFGLIGIGLGMFTPSFLQALPDRVFGIMANETLLAIPFFTFMGLILERSGMAEELLDTAGKLFGPVRGGVAYAVIFVGALLAATTGVVAASVIAMGLISLPIMLRYGYDRRLASGVITASGTLAQIIPPSLVLIILADQLGRSVGDMYAGAIIPGLVLTGLYMIYVFIMTVIYPKSAPALPAEARSFGQGAEYRPVITAATFPLMLVLWGMIVLFAPKLGIDLINGFVPGISEWIEARVVDEGPRMLAMLGAFAALYLVYVGALRYAPKILATALGAFFLLLALGVLWKAAGAFVAGFATLPSASERGLEFLLDLIAWVAGEWVYAVALMGLIGGGVSLLNAPSRPVSAAVWKIIADLLPPLVLIFLVLGTIFQGIATPTEGGAMGATGALILALARRKLSLDLLRQALEKTTNLSAFVIFILIGARVFSLTFYGVDGHKWVEHLLVSLPGGPLGFLIVVNILVFILAFFLDFFELAFIIVPLLVGPAEALGIDLIWFGVLLGINMQTSFMHPPFGFALFYLRSVAPRHSYKDRITGATIAPVTTGQIYWGAVPFVIIQLIMVGLAIAFPSMIMHYKGTGPTVDPNTIEITVPTDGGGDLTGPPSFD